MTVCCPQARRAVGTRRNQTSRKQKVDDADSQLPHHQPIRRIHKLIAPSWNHYYKTSHYPLQVRTHSFEAKNLLWPPVLGEAIKLFFSTSPKTLSPRFNSVSGYRGWIWLQNYIFKFAMMISQVAISFLTFPSSL